MAHVDPMTTDEPTNPTPKPPQPQPQGNPNPGRPSGTPQQPPRQDDRPTR